MTSPEGIITSDAAPPSIASSPMAPEDVELYHPKSTYDSNTESSEQASRTRSLRSRNGGGTKRVHMLGGSGFTMSNTSHPQSAVSRRSMAHAPAIASQAFFRPMSSQRLQAQRGLRSIQLTGDDLQDEPRLSTSTANRPSIELDTDMPPVQQKQEYHNSSSRDTDFTEQYMRDRAYCNSSPTGGNTIRTADSSQPLNERSNNLDMTPNIVDTFQQVPGTPRSYVSRIKPQSLNETKPEPNPHSRRSKDSVSLPSPGKMTPVGKAFTGRNYEFFSGNTVFCWGGRLQNTRHRPINILTGFLIILPAVLFFVFSASWLWHHVSPALPVICAYLFYICLSSFLHASVTDPGILPRNLHPLPLPDDDDPLAIGPPLSDWTMVKSTSPTVTAMDVPTRYCKTCNIWRPLRAHHCRMCDNCIETQDHHCVWLNNCVGRRNYRYFFTFILSAMALGIFLALSSLGQCIAFSSQKSVSFREAIDNNRVPFAMFIYGILVIPYPISLVGYHLFLMSRGETTREYLKSHKFPPKDRHRPFDQRNYLTNWLRILLRARTPTYLRFKDQYIEGDPRYGERRGQRQAPLSAEQQGGGMEMHAVGTP